MALLSGSAGKNRFGVGPLIAAGSGPKVVDEKLSVLDNGNVGIGTTAPKIKLHVKGDLGDPDGPVTLNLFGSQIGDMGVGDLQQRAHVTAPR